MTTETTHNGNYAEQRDAAQGWDNHIRNLIDERWEDMRTAIGNAIGMSIRDLRQELLKEMRVSLRIAILEDPQIGLQS